MPPNKFQKEAIEYLEGPLLVIAGPGTGKTQLLSKKVEYILEKTDANPENILCLTFTDSGAQNMRDRLFSMIGRAAAKVSIHTYHSFGSDILAEYQKYATEYLGEFDEPIDAILQYKMIKEIQENLPPRDILRGDKISDIIDTIASAKSARLSPDDLAKIAKINMDISKRMGPRLAEIINRLSTRKSWRFPMAVEEVYRPLCEALAEYVSDEPIVPGIFREANAYLLELDQIISDEGDKERPSVKPLSSWKDKRFEKDDDGNYRLKNVVSNKKLLSLSGVMREYNRRLSESGMFDFSDMIEEAIRILNKDAGFKATLSERYQYILLDEFQDTNPSQAELIYLLTDYEKPLVMAVGDDDQAIFEFQGATSSNFIDYQEHYGAKIVTLKDNYRSTAEILKFSRCIADQVENNFSKKYNIDKNLISHSKEKTKVERHEFLSADGEYYWVAEKIAELVRSGVSQKEIAIITPKHKYIAPLLPYLKAHDGIYINYEKRDNLFLDEKISELLTLAEFILGVAEDEPVEHLVLPILSFPCFEVSPLAAIRASRRDAKKASLDYFAEADDARVRWVGELLAALVQKSFEAPLELMLDYMIGTVEVSPGLRSPFLEYYVKTGSEYAEFNLYESLSVLRAALASYLKKVEQPKLKDLVRFARDAEEASFPLANTSPYSEAESAVQIMTAHKSKGLEFKYVFLVAVDNLSWGSSGGNNNLLVLPLNLIQIRHTGTTDDEHLRLLFVAITRAKTNLILTSSITDFAGKTPKRLMYLEEHEEEGRLISPFIGEMETHYADLEEAKKQTDLRLSWISAYKELTPDLKPILLERLSNYALTSTDLTSFIDVCYSGPAEFYKTKVLLAPREPLSGSLLFGTFVHKVFEKVTREGLSDEKTIEFFREEISSSSLLPAEKEEMLERGAVAIAKSLAEFGPILRYPGAGAEINFFSEHLEINEVPITGKIDHINIDKSTKTIELYDFKTSHYHSEKWDSNDTLYKYKLQLGFYKLLLNLSPVYAKYKVSRAHILFVEPDSYDEVHDKVYEFNEKDEKELLALISAVYREIKTLDFVSDSELFVEADNNKKLKDIKEFVKLVIDKNDDFC